MLLGPQNNNRGGRGNSRGSYRGNYRNNTARNRENGSSRQSSWASTQNTVYGHCNRCEIGHLPSHPNQPSQPRNQSQANYATHSDAGSHRSFNWLPDTGANDHAGVRVYFLATVLSTMDRCLDLTTKRVYIARHICFNEYVFPYHALPKDSNPPQLDNLNVSTYPIDPDLPESTPTLLPQLPLPQTQLSQQLILPKLKPPNPPKLIPPTPKPTQLPPQPKLLPILLQDLVKHILGLILNQQTAIILLLIWLPLYLTYLLYLLPLPLPMPLRSHVMPWLKNWRHLIKMVLGHWFLLLKMLMWLIGSSF
ncbi:hypothetical protein HanRHA438_Chr06g0272931 [Helianthus annuus]|nr:hypothetical protein HanIR_Chr06g0283551 [Helianthus annuus]KAJ0741142.1 hypothetical protein HanOQP8_Chr06g0224621 [Helianthus annuus]KAJ0912322.1 hypothetical protein HanRHA438_Chr06g0272931 [Helianthus annuus]